MSQSKPTILAFDGSTIRLYAALSCPSGTFTQEIEQKNGLESSLAVAIDQLTTMADLDLSELDALAVGLGPGSFTGLRIALSTAKGLSEGLGVPLLGVHLLEAMGLAWSQLPYPVLSIIDARKGRYYGLWTYKGQRMSDFNDHPLDELIAEYSHYETGYALAWAQCNDALDHINPSIAPKLIIDSHGGLGDGLLQLAIRQWENKDFLAPEAAPLYIREADARLPLKPLKFSFKGSKTN